MRTHWMKRSPCSMTQARSLLLRTRSQIYNALKMIRRQPFWRFDYFTNDSGGVTEASNLMMCVVEMSRLIDRAA